MFNFISCNKTWKFSVLTSRDTQWLRISNAAPEGLCSSKIGMTNDWKLVWCTAEFLIVNFLETFAFTVALSPAHHYRAKVNKPWNQTVDGLQLSIIKQRTELSDMTKISPFLILDNRIINQKRAYHIFCALGHILYRRGVIPIQKMIIWRYRWRLFTFFAKRHRQFWPAGAAGAKNYNIGAFTLKVDIKTIFSNQIFTKFLQRRRDSHDLLFSIVILPSFALRPFLGLLNEKSSARGFLLRNSRSVIELFWFRPL